MNQNEKPPVSREQYEKSNDDSWDFSELIDGIVLPEKDLKGEKEKQLDTIVENTREEITCVANKQKVQEPLPDIANENTEKIRTILRDLFFKLTTSLKMQMRNIDEQILALRREIGNMTIGEMNTSDKHYREMHETWVTEGEKYKRDKQTAITAIERLNMFREDFDNYDIFDLKNDWEFFKDVLRLNWKEVRLFAGLNEKAIDSVKRLFGEVVLNDIPNEEQRLCYKLLEKLLSWIRAEVVKLNETIRALNADKKELENEVTLLDHQISDYENGELSEYEKLVTRRSFREQQATSRIKKSSKIPRFSDEEMKKIENEIRQLKKDIDELNDGGYLENRKKELQDKEKKLEEKEFLKKREEKIRDDEAKLPEYETRFEAYGNRKRKITEKKYEIQKKIAEIFPALHKISVWVMAMEKFEDFIRDISQGFLETDDINIILKYVETIIQKDNVQGLDVPRIRQVTQRVRELLSGR